MSPDYKKSLYISVPGHLLVCRMTLKEPLNYEEEQGRGVYILEFTMIAKYKEHRQKGMLLQKFWLSQRRWILLGCETMQTWDIIWKLTSESSNAGLLNTLKTYSWRSYM